MSSTSHPLQVALPGDFEKQVFHMNPTQSNNGRVPQQQQPVFAVRQQKPLQLNVDLMEKLAKATCIIGAKVFVIGILATSLFGQSTYNKVGTGIWGGIIVFACGAYGMYSIRQPKNRALNDWSIRCNAFTAIICIVNLVLYGLAVDFFKNCAHYSGQPWNRRWNPDCTDPRNNPLATYIVLIILTSVQSIISFTIFTLRFKAAYPTISTAQVLLGCQGIFNNQPSTYQPMQFAAFPNANHPTNLQSNDGSQVVYMLTPVAIPEQQQQTPNDSGDTA